MNKTKWVIDPTHSEVGFKVKHLMITNVNGSFASFSGQAETEDETSFKNPSISFEADIASINTGNEQRDAHLKSPDFFDAEKFPKLQFISSHTEKTDDGFVLHGTFTIHGISKPTQLNVSFSGIAKDPWGNTKAGFSIEGKINRKDFGLTWNAPTETGGVLVSEEVKLQAEVQLVKQG
ncbi:MAG: YceI family protein [Bacteroidetes bacterium]|nr:YceI family protein [Bacteroidota bacterium]